MADPKTHSDSDDSDEDYIPDDKAGNVSEEADSGDAESDVEQEGSSPKTKRRRKAPEIVNDAKEDTDKKLDIDAIWADFKKDTDQTTKPVAVPKQPTPEVTGRIALDTKIAKPPVQKSNLQPTSSKGGGGGLASILGKLGKKDKLSTLEKSRLDWNNFKTSEGIDDEIKLHNRGKDGFLEKRDFLERTDMRQFELEKEMRTVKRSNR